ncbi:MAG: hypothetical protein MRY21_06695 [Simkaniaceae bacterium]|nr:hypothetical protein [Simkaniaceae bacterium]
MKLELDCTWNENKNRAKQSIHFDYRPKSLFSMPDEQVFELQKLAHSLPQATPEVIGQIEALLKKYPKSLYAQVNYYQVLLFFELIEDAEEISKQLQKEHPDALFTKCILGGELLSKKQYDRFPQLFNHIEVLKGAFPKRRSFFYEEALNFHNLWGRYFLETGNGAQADKHKKLLVFIMNTLQSCQRATAEV